MFSMCQLVYFALASAFIISTITPTHAAAIRSILIGFNLLVECCERDAKNLLYEQKVHVRIVWMTCRIDFLDT